MTAPVEVTVAVRTARIREAAARHRRRRTSASTIGDSRGTAPAFVVVRCEGCGDARYLADTDPLPDGWRCYAGGRVYACRQCATVTGAVTP